MARSGKVGWSELDSIQVVIRPGSTVRGRPPTGRLLTFRSIESGIRRRASRRISFSGAGYDGVQEREIFTFTAVVEIRMCPSSL